MAGGTYTTGGTGAWSSPVGVGTAPRVITIEAWGGGGAGGYSDSQTIGAGGGGGGGYSKTTNVTVPGAGSGTAGTTINYTVGTAGATAGTLGGPGGNSIWDTNVCIAAGGTGGQSGVMGGTGGVGGAVAGCTYSGATGTAFAGGKGGNGFGTGGGGGGGESGCGTSNGAPGTNGYGTNGGEGGASTDGGNGGAGGASHADGTAGVAPGGGGGGGGHYTGGKESGGAGAAGKIILTYTTLEQSPTVAYSSPADAGTITDTTPELIFTGTDANNDELEYNVQVATDTSFTPNGTGTVDSYGLGNDGNQALYNGSYIEAGQSFTGDGNTLHSVKFKLYKTGAPTGNATCYVYLDGGATYGTNSVPTGSALATSDTLDVATLGTSEPTEYTEIHFSGANQITLTNGTKYVVTIAYSGGNGTNYLQIRQHGNTPTHGGNMCRYQSSWAALTGTDLLFEVLYSQTGSILLNKYSDVDTSEFTGGDGHPFASAVAGTFTVQGGDALPENDTYYWRVSAKDPAGGNTYGAWGGTYSFVLGTSAPPPAAEYAGFKTLLGVGW